MARKATGRAGSGVVVTGVKEVDQKLHRLPVKLQKKITRKATRKAAKLVEAKAKEYAPVETGALQDSITTRALGKNIALNPNPKSQNPYINLNKGMIGHQVQTRDGLYQGDQYYGAFQELGTKHMDPNPYLRPALWDSEDEVHRLFLRAMREFVMEADQP